MNRLSLLNRQLQAERRKGRKRYVILIPLIFLMFQALWGIWQLGYASPDEIDAGYFLLFHHLPIMNTILLPMMAAVIASRLCDMEIKGDTLKLLYTMEKETAFFYCKYLAGVWYLLLFTLGQGIMILALGRFYDFGHGLKWLMLFEYLAVTLLVSSLLLVIQQTLSLLSSSQILPLATGLTGCFLGLFSLFLPAPAARLFVWGYYAAFPVAAMEWEPSTRVCCYYEVPFPGLFFLLFLIGSFGIYELCKFLTTRKEV